MFVFLLLAAQYESVLLPLAVILIVPMCLLAAISGVLLRGMDNNILTQIGFVVLIGLAAKNAILIVEFAKQAEEQGANRWDAAVQAARTRLRPILMTSFAFILGVVPLVIATGAGAEMRQALGTAVFFGMLGVTLFGLMFTPVFYVVVRWIGDKVARPRSCFRKRRQPLKGGVSDAYARTRPFRRQRANHNPKFARVRLRRLIGAPIAGVNLNCDLLASVAPIELLVRLVGGRAAELLVTQIELISLLSGSYFNSDPRDRQMFLSESDKAAEA